MNLLEPEDPNIADLLGAGLQAVRADILGLEDRFPGLRASHFRLLTLLPDEGTRITDIADRAAMTKQALGQFMRYLEGLGYVEITVDPRDRRARVVRKTTLGRRAERAGLAAVARLEQRWREQLGDRRYAALRKALVEVTASA